MTDAAAHGSPAAWPPFLFIVGCGRSGTTLLVTMLDSHPALAIPGESGFVVELARLGSREGAGAASAFADDFVRRIERFDRFRAWKLDGDILRSEIAGRGVTSGADAVRLTYGAYAATFGKPRYGDKTPDHVLEMGEIAELLPEAVFVHVVRDGRDVALASLAVDWGPRTVPEAARYWSRRVRAGRDVGGKLGAGRYLEVRYERLVEDAAGVLAEVVRFLGLDYDPVMLEYRGAAERQLAMSPSPSADRSLLRPPVRGLRDWRRDMSERDAAAFDRIAGDLLDELGYEPSPGGARAAGRRLHDLIAGRRQR